MTRVFKTCRILAAMAALALLLAACQTSGQDPVAEHAIQLPASVPDNEENRRAAAQRYLDTFELKELYARMGARMTEKMSDQVRVLFEAFLAGTDTQALDLAMIDALVRVYTADELNALAAFYGTDVGKSIYAKQDKFFAQMLPVLIQALLRKVTEAKTDRALSARPV